jgi:hypothetical protein
LLCICNFIYKYQSRLFKAQKTAKESGDKIALNAFESDVFLWQFLIAWKRTPEHGDIFLQAQRAYLSKFKPASAQPPALPQSKPTTSRPESSVPAPATTDEGAGTGQPLADARASGNTAGRNYQEGRRNNREGNGSQRDEAPRRTISPQGVAGPSRSKGPVADADADAVSAGEALQRRLREIAKVADGIASDDGGADSEYIDREEPTREEVGRNDDEAQESDQDNTEKKVRARRPRLPPVKSDKVNKIPCERCQLAKETCYAQAKGRGRGACYRCGKAKAKCSLKDDQAMLGAETQATAKGKPPMKPTPKVQQPANPKPRPMTKKSMAPKTPMAEAESEEETAPRRKTLKSKARVPTPSASSASASATDSPPRFSAREKGKGIGKTSLLHARSALPVKP